MLTTGRITNRCKSAVHGLYPTAPQRHSTTAPQHHSATAPQHHSTTASQHHSVTAPQRHSTTAPQHHTDVRISASRCEPIDSSQVSTTMNTSSPICNNCLTAPLCWAGKISCVVLGKRELPRSQTEQNRSCSARIFFNGDSDPV